MQNINKLINNSMKKKIQSSRQNVLEDRHIFKLKNSKNKTRFQVDISTTFVFECNP